MNTSILLRGLVATAILGALASSFSPASAADPSSASVTVNYADLNPASRSGALVLYKRIQAAAQNACSYFLFESDAEEALCVHRAIASAVDKVDQPALSAIFDLELRTLAAGSVVAQRR